MDRPVFITAMGKFLPGEPVGNDQIEQRLGQIGGKRSRSKDRILKQNQIRWRHYAIDDQQTSNFTNAEMAANSVRDALSRSSLDADDVELLCAATSMGDLVLPGFASMVHGELGNASCEVATTHGLCASGVMALKHAWLQIRVGEKRTAIACASEFASRALKASHYQAQNPTHGLLGFEAEFLRWMLSDGAGAAVLQDHPNPRRPSLRIDWIELKSYADRFDVCMYTGGTKDRSGEVPITWLDYASPQEAAEHGALNLRQDIRMLGDLVRVSVDFFFELIEAGRFRPDELDHLVVHYSSHVFKGEIEDLLEKAGVVFPDRVWFTNLYTKGNTGSASIYIMLEELLNEGDLQPGQRILCMVPESGRFITSFMHLTVVGPKGESPTQDAEDDLGRLQPEPPLLRVGGDPVREKLVRQLSRVWIDFETSLNRVPLIDRLNRGRFTLDDYRSLLVNLRQQVIEGARWIARAASNITIDASSLRSIFISHAEEEHRDYEMLERDYVAVGGDLEVIRNASKNIGSEALSAWMFHRASQENPFDLLGAMFIIEGMGTRLAHRWGTAIRRELQIGRDAVSFLLYHGANDANHLEHLEAGLMSEILTEDIAERIVKTAKVTARLYRLQLEELDRF